VVSADVEASDAAYTLLADVMHHFGRREPFSLAWAVEHGERVPEAWVDCESPRILLQVASQVVPLPVLVSIAVDIGTLGLPALMASTDIGAMDIAAGIIEVVRGAPADEGLLAALSTAARLEGSLREDPSWSGGRAMVAIVRLAIDGRLRKRQRSRHDQMVSREEHVNHLEHEIAMLLGDTDETAAAMVNVVRAHVPSLTLADLVEATR
jgi:hypothetical protein